MDENEQENCNKPVPWGWMSDRERNVEHFGPHVRKDAVPMQTSPRMVGWDIRGRVLGSEKTCEKKRTRTPRVQDGDL